MTLSVCVLGAGSWGTTVASLAARNGPTLLWARNPETAREINEARTNARYLREGSKTCASTSGPGCRSSVSARA